MGRGVGSIDGSGGFARRLWDSLSEEGVWGVPRSGLMFVKRGQQLVLIEQMPHEVGMPLLDYELEALQEEDYEGITDLFAVIGVEVVRANGAS
jgi:hypothetical protein